MIIYELTGYDTLSTDTVVELLNALLDTQRGQQLLWQASPDNGGVDLYDSPLWVRPVRLLDDGLPSGWMQVIGHTEVTSLTRFNNALSLSSFILTDCLASVMPQWLTLDFSN